MTDLSSGGCALGVAGYRDAGGYQASIVLSAGKGVALPVGVATAAVGSFLARGRAVADGNRYGGGCRRTTSGGFDEVVRW